MKVIISDFIDKKPNFSSLSQAEQVKYLAYFYIKTTNDEIFTPQNVKTYFELANLPKPKNIPDVFKKLKEKNIFISSQNGYILHRDALKELDKEFSDYEKETHEDKYEWIYDKGENYDIYKDIRTIVKKAATEVFIVDGYPDENIYQLYLDEIPNEVRIKFLTNRPQGKFLNVTQLWMKNPKKKLAIKKGEIHDRAIFVDNNECWVLGASIKDAGNKPTYLIKIRNKNKMYSIYSEIFNRGQNIFLTP
ncbi:MAG: hypothetical protein PHU34_06800 [Candidatus Methanoperedens sp.]|nr:hypothetical protein [Candidatus Methanoperedens sp.]